MLDWIVSVYIGDVLNKKTSWKFLAIVLAVQHKDLCRLGSLFDVCLHKVRLLFLIQFGF